MAEVGMKFIVNDTQINYIYGYMALDLSNNEEITRWAILAD